MVQVFTWPSVLLFDREFRKEQAEKNLSWDTEAAYLMSLLLRPLDKKAQMGPRKSQAQRMDDSGRPVCLRWNRSASGCKMQNCRFAHVCYSCLSPWHTEKGNPTPTNNDPKNL